MEAKTKRRIRFLFFLPYSIIFNFRYLPLSQAIKLPICFYVRPSFINLGGKVIIDSPIVHYNMIQLGRQIAPIDSYKGFRWQNRGKVVFSGNCLISHHFFISCGKDAIIRFGANSTFNYGCRVISQKGIFFGDKARISWECTFIDTDFHPLIDLTRGKPIKISQSIKIEYGCWIGHNSILSKGVRLAKNTTVSQGSVVKGVFKQENTLIGGNFAKVLDEGFIRDDA